MTIAKCRFPLSARAMWVIHGGLVIIFATNLYFQYRLSQQFQIIVERGPVFVEMLANQNDVKKMLENQQKQIEELKAGSLNEKRK